uniref:Eukaryotic initiation factor 4E n=1 Tax=Hirondellea gigas TaxID=1518452 RepID=A0A6A7G4Y5_9CRUS
MSDETKAKDVESVVEETASAGEESPKKSDPAPPLHALQHKWVFWFDQPKKKQRAGMLSLKEWNASLEQVYEFDTVEDFWCLFNNLLPASMIDRGASYSLFKSGVRPEWEDSANDGGGRWFFTLKEKDREQTDEFWLYLVLGLIGDIIDVKDDICGAVISPRERELRVSLWTKTASNEATQMEIGHNIRRVLKFPGRVGLNYRTHDNDSRSRRNNVFTC